MIVKVREKKKSTFLGGSRCTNIIVQGKRTSCDSSTCNIVALTWVYIYISNVTRRAQERVRLYRRKEFFIETRRGLNRQSWKNARRTILKAVYSKEKEEMKETKCIPVLHDDRWEILRGHVLCWQQYTRLPPPLLRRRQPYTIYTRTVALFLVPILYIYDVSVGGCWKVKCVRQKHAQRIRGTRGAHQTLWHDHGWWSHELRDGSATSDGYLVKFFTNRFL